MGSATAESVLQVERIERKIEDDEVVDRDGRKSLQIALG